MTLPETAVAPLRALTELRSFMRGFTHKELARIADCSPDTAKRYHAGHWPSAPHLFGILKAGGPTLIDRVFGDLFHGEHDPQHLLAVAQACLANLNVGQERFGDAELGVAPAFDRLTGAPLEVIEVRKLNAFEMVVATTDHLVGHPNFHDLLAWYRGERNSGAFPVWRPDFGRRFLIGEAMGRAVSERVAPFEYRFRDILIDPRIRSFEIDVPSLIGQPFDRHPYPDLVRTTIEDFEIAFARRGPIFIQVSFPQSTAFQPPKPRRFGAKRRTDRLLTPFSAVPGGPPVIMVSTVLVHGVTD